MSQIDITPERQTWLSGYGDRHSRSTDVYQSLRAGALYLSGPRDAALIIAADLLGYNRQFADGIRAVIAESVGLEPRQVVLTATHTHCGPHFFPMAFPGEIEQTYADLLHEKLIGAAGEARRAAVSGEIRFSRVRSSFGINRRLPDESSVAHFAPNPDGPVDRDLDTLWFTDDSGNDLGSLSVYGCHPTSLNGYSIGGDYPGFFCRSLESATGAPSLFATGCAGDVRPHYGSNSTDFPQPLLLAVEEAGNALSSETLAGRPQAEVVDSSELQLLADSHDLPYAYLPGGESIEAAARNRDLNRHTWARAMEAFAAELPTSCAHEIQALVLGDAFRVLFLSGEIFSEIGLRLKHALEPSTTIVVAYSNALIGYVPSAASYDFGGYEVNGSHHYFLQPGPFTKDAEQLIVDRTLQLLRLGPK